MNTANANPANWHPKVQAGTLAGAATVIIVWLLGELGADVPPAVASAITTLLTAIVAWVVPASSDG